MSVNAQKFHTGSKYVLAKISLIRAACPSEIMSSVENQSIYAPVIIHTNVKKYGTVAATNYCPETVVVSGAQRRKKLMDRGVVHSWAWVEASAIDSLRPTGYMTAAELMENIDSAIQAKYRSFNAGASELLASIQVKPQVTEIFPFEGYFTYQYGKNKFAQSYSLNIKAAGVSLIENRQDISATIDKMPGMVQTGIRFGYAPPTASAQSVHYGGKNCELITEVIRNWTNIDEAVKGYLDQIKGTGAAMKPAFYPNQMAQYGWGQKAETVMKAEGVNAFNFAKWSATAQMGRAAMDKEGSFQKVKQKFVGTLPGVVTTKAKKVTAGGPGSGRHSEGGGNYAENKWTSPAFKQEQAKESAHFKSLNIGDKVHGQFEGQHYTGTLRHAEGSTLPRGFGTEGHKYHVDLDKPLTHYGTERNQIRIRRTVGENNENTIHKM